MKIILGFNLRKAKLFWRKQRWLVIATSLTTILLFRVLKVI